MSFKLQSSFKPAGDQPQAIKQLVDGLETGEKAICAAGSLTTSVLGFG